MQAPIDTRSGLELFVDEHFLLTTVVLVALISLARFLTTLSFRVRKDSLVFAPALVWRIFTSAIANHIMIFRKRLSHTKCCAR